MTGVFRSPTYFFLLDENETEPGEENLTHFDDQDFDSRLVCPEVLPDLNGAPLGSWIIARLARLGDGRIGPFDGETQYVDGGRFCLDHLVYDSSMRPIASLQIQGGESVVIFGRCFADVDPESILAEYAAALLSRPEEIGSFRLYVNDPEDRSRRVYGHDGDKYLGISGKPGG